MTTITNDSSTKLFHPNSPISLRNYAKARLYQTIYLTIACIYWVVFIILSISETINSKSFFLISFWIWVSLFFILRINFHVKHYSFLLDVSEKKNILNKKSFRKSQKFGFLFSFGMSLIIAAALICYYYAISYTTIDPINMGFGRNFFAMLIGFLLLGLSSIFAIISNIFQTVSYSRLRSYFFPNPSINSPHSLENTSISAVSYELNKIFNNLKISYLIETILWGLTLILGFYAAIFMIFGFPVLEIIISINMFKWVNIHEESIDQIEEMRNQSHITQNTAISSTLTGNQQKNIPMSENILRLSPKFCPFCGEPINKTDIRFCPACGKNLE